MNPYVLFCYHANPYLQKPFEDILNKLENVNAIHHFQNEDDILSVMQNHPKIQIFTGFPKYNHKGLILLLSDDSGNFEHINLEQFDYRISLDSALNKKIVDLFAPTLSMGEVVKIVNSVGDEPKKVEITELSFDEIISKSGYTFMSENLEESLAAYEQYWLQLKSKKTNSKTFYYKLWDMLYDFYEIVKTIKQELFFYNLLTEDNQNRIDEYFTALADATSNRYNSKELIKYQQDNSDEE